MYMLRASSSGTHGADDDTRLVERRQIEHLQARAIDDERVAELDRDAARIVQTGTDLGRHFRLERVVHVDDDETAGRQDVRVMPGEHDAARTGQDAVGIERHRARQEIVRRIAVEQRADTRDIRTLEPIANNDQPLLRVGDVEEAVHQMDLLLFVHRILRPQRIDAERRWRSDGDCILRFDEQPLTQRRHRRRGDPFGEILVVDVGDVVNAEAVLAERHVRVFAAHLDVERVAGRMVIRLVEETTAVRRTRL